MRWGVPKQKRHCAAYGGIGHQVIIFQKQKDFVIATGLFWRRDQRFESFSLQRGVCKIQRLVAFEDTANRLPERVPGAFGRAAQRRFELSEDLLDRIEFGAVGRQVDELCTLRGDRFCNPGRLVAA